MKNGILYSGPFLFAFILVTGVIIYLNSTYNNIFAFDFSAKTNIEQSNDSSNTKTQKKNEIKKVSQTKPLKKPLVVKSPKLIVKTQDEVPGTKDSVRTKEPLQVAEVKDSSTAKLISETKNVKESPEQVNKVEDKLKQDEEYSEWLKKVTGIYESLAPVKAAKIIQTYSDNVARDILYNMRKKSAAKIVAELSPETANRIFRFE